MKLRHLFLVVALSLHVLAEMGKWCLAPILECQIMNSDLLHELTEATRTRSVHHYITTNQSVNVPTFEPRPRPIEVRIRDDKPRQPTPSLDEFMAGIQATVDYERRQRERQQPIAVYQVPAPVPTIRKID